MQRRQFTAFLIGATAVAPILFLDASRAGAQAPALASQAADFIVNLSLQAADLGDPTIGANERYNRFRALLNAAFDVPYLGEVAMGRYWRIASPEERAEYLHLFEDGLVLIYAERFKDYTGDTLRVLQARASRGPEGDEALVITEVPRPGLPAIRVAWRVRPADNSFLILDVTVDGVSMMVTQRDDYAALLQRAGGRIPALLVAMREKNISVVALPPAAPPAAPAAPPQGGARLFQPPPAASEL